MNDESRSDVPIYVARCFDHSFYRSVNGVNTEILVFKSDGTIVWNSPKGKIVIEDHKSLCLAFMDVICQRTGRDCMTLDPVVHADYIEWMKES